jgi:hypothetical protein
MRIKGEVFYKSIFKTLYGHFEFLVMPFRLINTLSMFMDLMNQVFRSFMNKCVIMFIDDIMVYFKSQVNHEQHLKMVL